MGGFTIESPIPKVNTPNGVPVPRMGYRSGIREQGMGIYLWKHSSYLTKKPASIIFAGLVERVGVEPTQCNHRGISIPRKESPLYLSGHLVSIQSPKRGHHCSPIRIFPCIGAILHQICTNIKKEGLPASRPRDEIHERRVEGSKYAREHMPQLSLSIQPAYVLGGSIYHRYWNWSG